MKIQKIALRVNKNTKSKKIGQTLVQALVSAGFSIVDDNPDLRIAIGGDGCFLRMVRENAFADNCLYTGIHTGTLGFLQEINPDEIPQFISYLKKKNYSLEKKDILRTLINTNQTSYNLSSLNELVIRNRTLKSLDLTISVDGNLLEDFAGDGILISTSIGSTAYNMSFRGTLVDNALSTMQITPIAPLINKHYHNLVDSLVLPDTRIIEIYPNQSNLLITVDGDDHTIDKVTKITVSMDKDALPCLLFKNAPFVAKVREKLLK